MNQEQIVSNLLITDQLKQIISKASRILEKIRSFERNLTLHGKGAGSNVTRLIPKAIQPGDKITNLGNEDPNLINCLSLMSGLLANNTFNSDIEYLYWFRDTISGALDNLNVFIDGLEQKYQKLSRAQLIDISKPLGDLKLTMNAIAKATKGC